MSEDEASTLDLTAGLGFVISESESEASRFIPRGAGADLKSNIHSK